MQYLAALIALLPAAFAAPFDQPSSYAQSCSDRSQHLTWSVSDLFFSSSRIFTTPAHQNPWGQVSFNLTNPATNSVTACSAYSSQLSDFFYGTVWYQCANNNDTSVSATYFRYDRPTGRLDLNQTWACNDAASP